MHLAFLSAMRCLYPICVLVFGFVCLVPGGVADAAKGFLGADAIPVTRKIVQTPLPMSGKQLQRRLKPLLRGNLLGHNYDSLIFINRYLSHFKTKQAENVSTSAVEAYWSYRPEAVSEARGKNHGSHCFGLATELTGRLARQKISAVITPSVQWVPAEGMGDPSKPRYDHAAAMVPFQNPSDPHDRGVAILDPGLNFSSPIIVRPNRPTKTRRGGLNLTCTLDESSGAINISHSDRFHAFYHLREWRNPDPRLTRLILTKNPKPEILARNEKGQVVAALRLDLRRRQVLINVEGQKTTVSFEDRKGISKAISKSLARHLGQDVHTLLQRVTQVIDHEGTLQQLRDITR